MDGLFSGHLMAAILGPISAVLPQRTQFVIVGELLRQHTPPPMLALLAVIVLLAITEVGSANCRVIPPPFPAKFPIIMLLRMTGEP
jgi:hypothetical protein